MLLHGGYNTVSPPKTIQKQQSTIIQASRHPKMKILPALPQDS
jgi:hypothetical protein